MMSSCGKRPMSTRSSVGDGQAQLTEAEITRFDKRLESFEPAFAAEARRLHPAERDRRAREPGTVHGDHREVELADYLENSVQILCAKIRGESVLRVVCACDRFIQRVERRHGRNGCE